MKTFTPTLIAFTFLLQSGFCADAPAGTLKLATPGADRIIDYSKYGDFHGIGTDKFGFTIKDRDGLAAVSGEGIDPNRSVLQDPGFLDARKRRAIGGSHWNYTDHADKPLRFYAWASAKEDPGVRQYFIAKTLEDNGQLIQALKAYHAVVVLYPKAVGWTCWKTPLYMSRMALDRIDYLLSRHPELNLSLEGAFAKIENGFDDDITNDKIVVDPGRWVSKAPASQGPDLSAAKIVKRTGGPRIQLVQYDNGHWQLLKDGVPFPIRAIAYTPTPVGLGSKTPGYEINETWQTADRNNNGLIDGIEESWVDANRNNIQDPDEPMTSDMELLNKLGVNTVRLYHHSSNKELFRRWHEKYGTMFLMGDFAGAYAIESGVDFYTGTDYANPEQCQRLLESIRKMVLSEKDEPYVLMWVLGNENVYGVGSSAKRDPASFFKFINRAAEMIHQLDPSHPVAVSSGDLYHFEHFVEFAPAVDVYGCNIYRGNGGMGKSFWRTIRELSGKPVIITEYGNSAYGKDCTDQEVDAFTTGYHQGNWEDIARNMGGGPGYGNALGGVAFEFCDEWWKDENNPQNEHSTTPQFPAPYCDGHNYEEWYGFYGIGNGQNSPFMRQARKVVEYYTEVWNSR